MYYEDTRRRLITLVVIAAIIASGCQVYKWAIMGSANRHLTQAEAAVKALDLSAAELQKTLASAKNKHPANYLTELRPDELLMPLNEAQTLLEQAKKARHPSTRHRLANRIIAVCVKADVISQLWQDELQLLDTALANYEREPEKLVAMMNEATREAGRLEDEGFFPACFTEPRGLIAEADKQLQVALSLMKKSPSDGAKPDYRRIYLTCLEAEKTAASAKSLILDIPRLRDANSSRADKLARDTDTASKSYNSARVAAAALEQYPGYRCLERVKQAKARLSLVQPLIDRAVDANSMQRQDFSGAAALLSRADGILATVVAEFDYARNKQQEAASAVANADSARGSAVSAIDRASSHISYYSHNSQSSAKNRLNTAESELDQGDLLRSSDPITALSHFQSAESEADSAYNAVDTSSDDDDYGNIFSSSSGDDDGGGGGLLGSDGGDSSGSGSSGGGGGSGLGGSSESGGSSGGGGGEYGGPSGGEHGGPSGGESGDGL